MPVSLVTPEDEMTNNGPQKYIIFEDYCLYRGIDNRIVATIKKKIAVVDTDIP